MSKLVFNRDGGKTDEFGHLLGLARSMQGEVIEGLLVAANGSPDMTVNVPIGTAMIPTSSGGTAYKYFVGLDATESVTITTANPSNPRNDLIVMYVDIAVTASQSYTNNSNNMLKLAAVAGTPAASPADPSIANIQAAIGAANPYIILARVVVGAGVTQINSGNITDLRNLATVLRAGNSSLLDNSISTAKLQNISVTAGKIDYSTITLGYKEILTFSSVLSVGVYVDIPNWTFSFTVPSGVARLKITLVMPQVYTSSDGLRHDFAIVDDGGVVRQTQYARLWTGSTAGGPHVLTAVVQNPAAGTRTYKLRVYAANATVSIYANNASGGANHAIGIMMAEVM